MKSCGNAEAGERMQIITLIDGYNVLGAWEKGERWTMADARETLIEKAENHAAAVGSPTVLVFDGHLRADHQGTVEERSETFSVVYTKTGQTADGYIDRLCAQLCAQKRRVRVVSGDGGIQTMVLALGALRMTPREYLEELSKKSAQLRAYANAGRSRHTNTVFSGAEEWQLELLEQLRRE